MAVPHVYTLQDGGTECIFITLSDGGSTPRVHTYSNDSPVYHQNMEMTLLQLNPCDINQQKYHTDSIATASFSYLCGKQDYYCYMYVHVEPPSLSVIDICTLVAAILECKYMRDCHPRVLPYLPRPRSYVTWHF